MWRTGALRVTCEEHVAGVAGRAGYEVPPTTALRKAKRLGIDYSVRPRVSEPLQLTRDEAKTSSAP
jgi:hypothetical protein